MSRKTKIILTVVVLALVAIGLYRWQQTPAQPTYQTETVRRGTVAETVSVTGELVPTEYADLSFQKIGVVDHVYVTEGERVGAGQKIASLDRVVLQTELNQARVAAAIAVEEERLARKKSKTNEEEERAAKKLASEQARERVRSIVAQMDESIIVSPMAGVVSQADIRVGETSALGKVVARVSEGDLIIEARVPESDIAKVVSGMTASVTFDALSTADVFEAEVAEIDRGATVVQDVVSYVVKFRLKDTDSRLKEGMTANVDIATKKRENVSVLPFRAVVKEGGKSFADVKQTDGTLKRVEVKTGLEGDDGLVEIVSGLSEGDQVGIIAPQK